MQRRKELFEELAKINRELLSIGFTHSQIEQFWNDSMAEALISFHLPGCNCDDVNQCETWCQVKARFKKKPSGSYGNS